MERSTQQDSEKFSQGNAFFGAHAIFSTKDVYNLPGIVNLTQ